MTEKQQYEFNRILMGNQIFIMRALMPNLPPYMAEHLKIRVNDAKSWWRLEFGKEVGFSAALGDEPVKK